MQRAKHMMQWLIQKQDSYFNAWREWMFREAAVPWREGISPRKSAGRSNRKRHETPGDALQQLVGNWIQPSTERSAEEILTYQTDLEELATAAVSWSVSGEWLIELPRDLPGHQLLMTEEEESFWPTYQWSENPWIVDIEGKVLSRRTYDRIQECKLEDLNITRIAQTTYSFVIPEAEEKQHQQGKLRRWGVAILLNAPNIAVGMRLQVKKQLRLRHPMQLSHEYDWEASGKGMATGTTIDEADGSRHNIVVMQQANGLYWLVQEENHLDAATTADRDQMKRRQHEGSIMFYANPRIHGFPWTVKDTIANKHVLAVLKKQPYHRYKGEGVKISKLLEGLQEKMNTSTWQKAVMRQTPTQIWAHTRELTEYQVWVVYRVAVRQLNLYYEGKAQDNGCRKLPECSNSKETVEHIFWECPCAQACWAQLIQQWTGETWTREGIQGWQQNCASRQAPPRKQSRRMRSMIDSPDDEKAIEQVWQRMWRILASICVTTLWIQRNRVVFNGEAVSTESSAQEFWATGMTQLKAIAKKERRSQDQQIQGTRMYLCQQEMEREPRETSLSVKSPVQPPDQDKASALLARLRNYQASRNQ